MITHYFQFQEQASTPVKKSMLIGNTLNDICEYTHKNDKNIVSSQYQPSTNPVNPLVSISYCTPTTNKVSLIPKQCFEDNNIHPPFFVVELNYDK